MFDYIDLDENQIAGLEASGSGALGAAGLLITNGVRQGVLTPEEAMKHVHNLFVALFHAE